ncbi:YcaO-like family protein [Nitrospira sp. MA-1]|nr:YcaO-like family protein [Nitrospira sp. MA-1]HNP30908.1 YcaO-like family protein [Nitrospirales bacterium]
MIHSTPDLEQLSYLVENLVDRSVGIVRHVSQAPREPGAPDFFHYLAKAGNTLALCDQKNSSFGSGTSSNRASALGKALGEAVERYCSAIYNKEELPLTSFAEASFPCIPPSDWALFSEKQYSQLGFRFSPFDRNIPLRWVQATDLLQDTPCYVPAAMVFLPYSFNRENGEVPITQTISTGLACHGSRTKAIHSAICEVIERDAFTITWQARLGRPHIKVETLSDLNRDLVHRLERINSTVTLLNLTMDVGIPTILSVLHSHVPDSPALVFAASADLDPEEAVRKSLEELAHTRRLAQLLKTNLSPCIPDENFGNIVNQDLHVHLYCDHKNTNLADFIFESRQRIGFDEIENLATGDPEINLWTLLEKVENVHHRVLVVDLTTPDVRESGLFVFRALIPGFHPLFMGHEIRALGGTRLWQVPQKLGYQGITKLTGDNPAPHPFP